MFHGIECTYPRTASEGSVSSSFRTGRRSNPAHTGDSSILPAVTVATILSQTYGWDPLPIGLGYGTSLTVGSFLGETAGGWVVDYLIVRGPISSYRCLGQKNY